jgi:hypothetical protein
MQFGRHLPAACIFLFVLLLSIGDSGSMMRSPIGGGLLMTIMLVFWLPLRLVKDDEPGAAFAVGCGTYFLGQGLLGIGAWTAITTLDRGFSRVSTQTVTVVRSDKGMSKDGRGRVTVWTDLVVRLPNGHERNYHKVVSEDHAAGETLTARVRSGPLFESVELL